MEDVFPVIEPFPEKVSVHSVTLSLAALNSKAFNWLCGRLSRAINSAAQQKRKTLVETLHFPFPPPPRRGNKIEKYLNLNCDDDPKF